MIKKKETMPLTQKTACGKTNGNKFFSRVKNKLKGKSILITELIIVVLICGLFLQNSKMIDKMQKLLGQADTSIHEIYDDAKVIQAYKSGNTDQLDAKDRFVYEQLKKVIDENIKKDMTDYEKEKAIYDWQVKWTTYGDENLNPISASSETHTPYGVLKSHEAICVGNATTFKLFMDALDIPCKIIHSVEKGEHAWNIVQLDGEWYHVDVTFDGSVNGDAKYNYFNVPDSIKDDGSWPWDHDKIPAADGTKYCQLLNNARECNNFYDIPKVLKEAADNDEGYATVILTDREGFTKSVAEYIAGMIYVNKGGIAYDGAYSLDGKVVFKFTIDKWEEKPTDEVPPEIIEKLNIIMDNLNNHNDIEYNAVG